MNLGDAIASIFTGGAGGLLGVLGNCVNTWMAMKQQKQDHEFQIAMVPLQLNADIERTKAEVAKVQETGAAASFVASQEADKLTGRESSRIAGIKAMVRPVTLFLLWCGVTAIVLSGRANEEMTEYIIRNIVSDASMATAWYFGARANALVMQGFKSKAGT